MAESSSPSIPALPGLAVETVEWLPSGAESGLVRVRGRWTDEGARQPDLPVLALRAAGAEHRFDSLPDARFSREPASWRGTYLVPGGAGRRRSRRAVAGVGGRRPCRAAGPVARRRAAAGAGSGAA